ncbi:MAG: hypothetical protein U9O97_05540 [Elusimicrobiota bacterium]|nr:hypothetical protein [Elusimicrobiota bacterium]
MKKIIKKEEVSAVQSNCRAASAKNFEIWNELSSFWIKVRKGDFLKKAYEEKKKREKEIFRRIRMAE